MTTFHHCADCGGATAMTLSDVLETGVTPRCRSCQVNYDDALSRVRPQDSSLSARDTDMARWTTEDLPEDQMRRRESYWVDCTGYVYSTASDAHDRGIELQKQFREQEFRVAGDRNRGYRVERREHS